MANSYHDELGKFCSRNEMMQSIDRLSRMNDYNEFSKLKDQFEKIERKKNGAVAAFFGIETKAQQAEKEERVSISHALIHHYRHSSVVLVDSIQKSLALPVDAASPHARYDEVTDLISRHFQKESNNSDGVSYSTSRTATRVAAMIFESLNRGDEIDLKKLK